MNLSRIVEGVPYNTKLTWAGQKYKYPVTITRRGKRLWLQFGFNRALSDELKATMQGAKWHGYDDVPIKQWSIADGPRTAFRLAYMEGMDPYAAYNAPLLPCVTSRPLYKHQVDFVSHMITRRYCRGNLEMGLGKTVAAIEAMEYLASSAGIRSWFYVAPKSALASVQIEFERWRSLIFPQFVTYDELKRIVANWPEGAPPPAGVIFDESSRLKNPSAQRTQAAQHLADSIRAEWGDRGAVILMTGSPSPKSPVDHWSQCEIACPGFIREGRMETFRNRLAVLKEGQSEAGGTFTTVAAWRDDPLKCRQCGKMEIDPDHDEINLTERWYHPYAPSVNEVELLHRRMEGLALTRFKRDCLDLPDKIYRVVRCKPTQSTINAARLLVATGGAAVKVQVLLRELSDGFQYQNTDVGTERCPVCLGDKTRRDWEYVGPESDYERMVEVQFGGGNLPSSHFREVDAACNYCSGTGEVSKFVRDAVQIPCPKEDAYLDLLDEYEEVGRVVSYAGFTGSVDRVVQASVRAGWEVIRVDGRGWWSSVADLRDAKQMIRAFQYGHATHSKLAFVGQPGAAGLGLNLTASPVVIYYSNDFNAESRIQSEDRIHRIGMDANRGATIVDIYHLPTDEYVHNNLKVKRRLQDVTMGELRVAFELGA